MKGAAAILIVASTSIAHATEPATLTLTCQGTTTITAEDSKPEPISIGITLNFTARTMVGFYSPSGEGFPVKITGLSEANVAFGGSNKTDTWFIDGNIDRATGDVEASSVIFDQTTRSFLPSVSYSLKCRSA